MTFHETAPLSAVLAGVRPGAVGAPAAAPRRAARGRRHRCLGGLRHQHPYQSLLSDFLLPLCPGRNGPYRRKVFKGAPEDRTGAAPLRHGRPAPDLPASGFKSHGKTVHRPGTGRKGAGPAPVPAKLPEPAGTGGRKTRAPGPSDRFFPLALALPVQPNSTVPFCPNARSRSSWTA